MNEWGFAAELKTWWDAEFLHHPDWRLTRCEVERGLDDGSYQRSDLSVLGRGVVRLAGELRLPDHPRASPWHPDNLLDAINKATTMGARWAFTSDATVFLLIDTALTGPPQTRVVQSIDLIPFQNRAQLDSDAFLGNIQAAWTDAIRSIAPVILGLVIPRGMETDELFINSLRALLTAPVAAIRDELNRRRSTNEDFERMLVTWMVDEQGWSHLPQQWDAEVTRTALLTAYVFVTRLMFYEALRRAHPTLSKLSLPTVDAAVAEALFRGFFEQAKVKSGDYETLFNWDKASEFALMADASIPGWQRVLQHLGVFDLTTVGFDIMGKMFERLIDPHERYRWGQHYTKPDVVDLMLSFGIPDGRGAVLDPAAGGGTFLVRAYVRKRTLGPPESHQQLLSELYGVDVSAFAANLATVNLAVRHLQFEQNYPRIAVKSFFQIDPAQRFLTLPAPRRTALGEPTLTPVEIGYVRAVVCNPPYVRLHELGRDRQDEAERVLAHPYGRVPVPPKVHGLSNYHLYFWFHGAQFLEKGGRLVLITSGEWLDSDYGSVLQEWLLDHFVIECCIESFAEPWFSEARVGTVVLAARLPLDDEDHSRHLVPFVVLRRALFDLYGVANNDAEHFGHVDALRDRLVGLSGRYGETDDLDWSTVLQADLRTLGSIGGRYVGRPWRARFLRAPKVAFELAERADFVPLDDLATVRLGLKTGYDDFFYLTRLAKTTREQTLFESGRASTVTVRGMDGWEGSFSTRDVLRAALNPHQLLGPAGRGFNIPAATEALYLYPRDKQPVGDLAAYVDFAEKAGVHGKQLVHSNGSPNRWYRQVRGIVQSRWALPYNSGYSYGAWNNAGGAVLNGRFVGVDPKEGVDADLLGAVLNSTFVMATRLLEGTATGVEGAFDVGPPAVRRMMVPDVRRISERHAAVIRDIVNDMRSRDLMPPAPTRDAAVDPLRHKLDLAILQGLGATRGAASAVAGHLYDRYARWRRAVEDVEAMMRVNRRTMQRQGQGRGVKPIELAARRVWEELSASVKLYPGDHLTPEEALDGVQVPRSFKVSDQEPMFQPGVIGLPNGKEVDLGSYDRVRYAGMLIAVGFQPPLLIPVDSSKAGAVADAFQSDLVAFRKRARERASSYIAEGSLADVVEAAERLWLKASRARGMTPESKVPVTDQT